jgi:biopolymer transport protein ExbD
MNRLYRKKRSNDATLPTISLTPLIDTVLVLLVIFMVTTPGKTNNQLSKQSDKGDNVPKAVWLVEIDANGTIYLNRKQIALNGLLDQVKQDVPASGEIKNVFVHANKLTSFSVLSKVLDGLRRIDHVGIMVG